MATYARAHGSPIAHILVPGLKITLCGRDATLMARWSSADTATSPDRRAWRTCERCEASRATAPRRTPRVPHPRPGR